MHLSKSHVGGLVFVEFQYFVAVGDFGRACNLEPVFGAAAVFLQA